MLRKLTLKLIKRFIQPIITRAVMRQPDVLIGVNYLARWWLIKNVRDQDTGDQFSLKKYHRTSKWFNSYLHCVRSNDDDRALHDHPWLNISIIISGTYREVLADRTRLRKPGDIVFRFGSTAHRLEVVEGPVWSLFITGPKYREWGFRCPNGWKHWKEYTDYYGSGDSTKIGRGCGE